MAVQGSYAPALTSIPRDRGLLRWALKLDVAVTGANGVAYLVAAGALDGVLGIPAWFLRAVGAFLLVFAAAVLLVATREQLSRPAVLAVIAANVLWAVDSVALVAAGTFDPTTAGVVWTLLQAAVVVLFAALQLLGRRRLAD